MKTAGINLRGLDSLRGLLAVYVIVGHCRWLLWAGHSNWLASHPAWWELPLGYASALFRFGHEAVMVFFVLSGFFIHLKAACSFEQSPSVVFDARTFYRRRLHRLLAPYVFALLVTICLDAVGRFLFPTLYLARTGDALIDANFERMGYSYESVLPALACLPNSLGKSFGTNGPLWSLAFEVCYYAAYPILLWSRQSHALIAFIAIPALAIVQQWFLPPGFLSGVLSHYPVWIAGTILAELVVRCQWAREKWGPPSGLLLLGSAAHFAAPGLARLQIDSVCYSVGVVWLFVICRPLIMGFRVARIFEWLGVRSYSLYIMHFPVVVLISATVFSKWGTRPFSGWAALLGVCSSVLAGCVAFQLCERKFLHPRVGGNLLTTAEKAT
jgi:peptidoglycan/LPS O-acetylase OafA/YrhL